MRYSRPADKLNPALDLGPLEAFALDLGEGAQSFAANHLSLATPDDLAALGFSAYEPPPPAPPKLGPEDVALSRVQLHLVLFMPQAAGGLGFSEAEIGAFIARLPPGQKEAAAIRLAQSDSFNWDHAFVQTLIPAVMTAKGLTVDQIRAAWMAASVL